DLPPTVAIVEPKADPNVEQRLPLGGTLPLIIEAEDPDFKLSALTFDVGRERESLAKDRLLSAPQAGKFRANYVLDTRKLDLQVGDLIVYSATAEDNRQPEANRVTTAQFKVRIYQ